MEELIRRSDAIKSLMQYAEGKKTIGQCIDECETIEQWIPVSERLPKNNMPCLVSVGEFFLTQIAMYSDLMGTINHKIFYIGDYGEENFEDITKYVKAWMPLPKPYKESEVQDADSD